MWNSGIGHAQTVDARKQWIPGFLSTPTHKIIRKEPGLGKQNTIIVLCYVVIYVVVYVVIAMLLVLCSNLAFAM